MVGERVSFTPEQRQLLEQTKGKVLGMLNGTEGLSEENRATLVGRIAGFFVEASEVPIFEGIILASIEEGSKLQLLIAVKERPAAPYTSTIQRLKPEKLLSADTTGQSNHLSALTKEHLLSGTPGIHFKRVLAENLNGQSSEEYLRATNSGATFLGELVTAAAKR